MGNPAAVVATYLNNYVSSFDLQQIKYLPELKRRYGDQGVGFIDMLLALGYERTEDVEIVQHFEEDWIQETVANLTLTSAGAAGADVTMTVAPASLDSNNRMYARVNDTTVFTNGTTAYIYSINTSTPSAPVITWRPHSSTGVIPAIAAGQELGITGSNWSENSGQPSGRAQGAFKYYNYFQIEKEKVGASGSQMTNASWVKTVDNKGIDGWYMKGVTIDMDTRMKRQLIGTFFTQQWTTNTSATDATNGDATLVNKTTEGWIPYLDRLSNPYPYQANTFGPTDFDEFSRIIQKNWGGRIVQGLLGQDLSIEVENSLQDYFKYTAINNTEKQANDQLFGASPEGGALAAVVSFNYLTKSNRTYAFKLNEIFSDPKMFNLTNYKYTGRGIFYTLGKNKDKMTAKDLPSIGLVFKGMGKYKRKMEMWSIGSANGETYGYQNEIDGRNWNMRTEFSTEFFGANQMINVFLS